MNQALSSLLPALVAGLVGGVAGFLLAAAIGPDVEARQPAATSAIGGDDDVLEALEAIRRELASLRGSLELVPPTASPPRDAREPIEESAPERDELAARLDALIAALRGSAAGGSSSLRLPVGAPPVPLPPALPDDSSAWEESQREHRLMSFQQVLDRYGKPTEVRTYDNRGTLWIYIEDDGGEVHFTFSDGLLTRYERVN